MKKSQNSELESVFQSSTYYTTTNRGSIIQEEHKTSSFQITVEYEGRRHNINITANPDQRLEEALMQSNLFRGYSILEIRTSRSELLSRTFLAQDVHRLQADGQIVLHIKSIKNSLTSSKTNGGPKKKKKRGRHSDFNMACQSIIRQNHGPSEYTANIPKPLTIIPEPSSSLIEEGSEQEVLITNPDQIDIAFLYSFPLVGEEIDNVKPFNYVEEYKQMCDEIYRAQTGINKKKCHVIAMALTKKNFSEIIQKNPKIIHISCHGGQNREEGNYLVFETELGEAERVYTSQIEQELRQQYVGNYSQSLSTDFVFLSACHSEAIGQVFIDCGIKSVLAISNIGKISEDFAVELAKKLYSNMIQGKGVEESLQNVGNGVLPTCCCFHKHLDTCKQVQKEETKNFGEQFHKDHEKVMQEPCTCNCNNEGIEHGFNCQRLKEFKKLLNPFNSINEGMVTELLCCCDIREHGEKLRLRLLGAANPFQNQQSGEFKIINFGRKEQLKSNLNNLVNISFFVPKTLALVQKCVEFFIKTQDSIDKRILILKGLEGTGKSSSVKMAIEYYNHRQKKELSYYWIPKNKKYTSSDQKYLLYKNCNPNDETFRGQLNTILGTTDRCIVCTTRERDIEDFKDNRVEELDSSLLKADEVIKYLNIFSKKKERIAKIENQRIPDISLEKFGDYVQAINYTPQEEDFDTKIREINLPRHESLYRKGYQMFNYKLKKVEQKIMWFLSQAPVKPNQVQLESLTQQLHLGSSQIDFLTTLNENEALQVYLQDGAESGEDKGYVQYLLLSYFALVGISSVAQKYESLVEEDILFKFTCQFKPLPSEESQNFQKIIDHFLDDQQVYLQEQDILQRLLELIEIIVAFTALRDKENCLQLLFKLERKEFMKIKHPIMVDIQCYLNIIDFTIRKQLNWNQLLPTGENERYHDQLYLIKNLDQFEVSNEHSDLMKAKIVIRNYNFDDQDIKVNVRDANQAAQFFKIHKLPRHYVKCKLIASKLELRRKNYIDANKYCGDCQQYAELSRLEFDIENQQQRINSLVVKLRITVLTCYPLVYAGRNIGEQSAVSQPLDLAKSYFEHCQFAANLNDSGKQIELNFQPLSHELLIPLKSLEKSTPDFLILTSPYQQADTLPSTDNCGKLIDLDKNLIKDLKLRGINFLFLALPNGRNAAETIKKYWKVPFIFFFEAALKEVEFGFENNEIADQLDVFAVFIKNILSGKTVGESVRDVARASPDLKTLPENLDQSTEIKFQNILQGRVQVMNSNLHPRCQGPMFGRNHELFKILQEINDAKKKDKKIRIKGPPKVGKRRLVEEVKAYLQLFEKQQFEFYYIDCLSLKNSDDLKEELERQQINYLLSESSCIESSSQSSQAHEQRSNKRLVLVYYNNYSNESNHLLEHFNMLNNSEAIIIWLDKQNQDVKQQQFRVLELEPLPLASQVKLVQYYSGNEDQIFNLVQPIQGDCHALMALALILRVLDQGDIEIEKQLSNSMMKSRYIPSDDLPDNNEKDEKLQLESSLVQSLVIVPTRKITIDQYQKNSEDSQSVFYAYSSSFHLTQQDCLIQQDSAPMQGIVLDFQKMNSLPFILDSRKTVKYQEHTNIKIKFEYDDIGDAFETIENIPYWYISFILNMEHTQSYEQPRSGVFEEFRRLSKELLKMRVKQVNNQKKVILDKMSRKVDEYKNQDLKEEYHPIKATLEIQEFD